MLVCGIIVRVFGETMVNDLLLTFHFWEVAGQCLNTLLFVLGGERDCMQFFSGWVIVGFFIGVLRS